MTLELAPEVKEPAALLEHEGFSSPQQAEALTEIAEAFDRELAEAASDTGADDSILSIAWADAKARADARYRLLFGDVAFNHASAQAAREALAGR